MRILFTTLLFALFISCAAQRADKGTVTALPPLPSDVPGLLALMPAEDGRQAARVSSALLAMPKGTIAEIFSMLEPPGGNDARARYAVSGLTKYLSSVDADGERKRYEKEVLTAIAVEEDWHIKVFLIEQLQWVGSESSVAMLVELQEDPRLKSAATLARTKIERSYLAPSPTSSDTISNNLDTAHGHRLAAMLSDMTSEPDEHTLNILLSIMDRAEYADRAAALAFAQRVPGEVATQAWIRKMASVDSSRKIEIVNMLAERGDRSALPALLTAGASEDADLALAALAAVANYDNKAALPGILEQLKNVDNAMRAENIRMLLATNYGSDTMSEIAALLPEAGPLGQEIILGLIVSRRASKFKEQIYDLRNAERRKSRMAAINAFAEFADRSDLDRLHDWMLAAPSDNEAAALQTVIAAIVRTPGPQHPSAVTLKRLDTAPPYEQPRLIATLGRIADATALLTILQKRNCADSACRDAAIRALADWPRPEVLPQLLEIAKAGENPVHKVLALRGYVRLTGLDSSATPVETASRYDEAIGLAENTAERRMILSGLAEVPTPRTLSLASGFMSEPDLANEAAVAVLQIAEAGKEALASQLREPLEKIVTTSADSVYQQQATDLLGYISRFEGHVTTWQVSGPHLKEDVSLFDHRFGPEVQPSSSDWQIYQAKAPSSWRISLDKFIGGDSRVAYLRNRIWMDEAAELTVELGSDDGFKFWVNGVYIFGNNTARGVSPSADSCLVKFKKGWNTLVLKVVNGTGGWAACVRLRDQNGKIVVPSRIEASGDDQSLEAVAPEVVDAAEPVEQEMAVVPAGVTKYDGKDDRNNMPPDGFRALFNGKDLENWKGLVKSPPERAEMNRADLVYYQSIANDTMRAHWRVENGMLIFDGRGFHSICTEEDFGNFEMWVDWKIGKEGDSGLYLRGSPQVQIWDFEQWKIGSGGLYNNQQNPSKPMGIADNPIGEWNRFFIRMVDERVTVYLNNIPVVDNVILENYWERDKAIYPLGQIELQAHKTPLWFRNIFIRELPDTVITESRALFNSTDLSGWQAIDGPLDKWIVQDGELYPADGGSGWLSTDREYTDFKLELEFNLPEGGNSGVFLRAPHQGDPAYTGMEIQVLDDYAEKYAELKPWQYCGSIYAVEAAKKVSRPAGEWQTYEITCKGPLVKVVLNGTTIIDTNLIDHMDKTPRNPGLKRRSGYIGLQNHGAPVRFRNIRITEL